MLVDSLISLITGQNPGSVDLTAYQTKINAVVAILGARVYKSVLPRGYTLPAAAMHRYSGDQDYEFSGPVNASEDSVQLDIYGRTATEASLAAKAVKDLLNAFVGLLPDGTTRVQACFLERDMDMPFMAQADQKGLAFRTVLGYRIAS